MYYSCLCNHLMLVPCAIHSMVLCSLCCRPHVYVLYAVYYLFRVCTIILLPTNVALALVTYYRECIWVHLYPIHTPCSACFVSRHYRFVIYPSLSLLYTTSTSNYYIQVYIHGLSTRNNTHYTTCSCNMYKLPLATFKIYASTWAVAFDRLQPVKKNYLLLSYKSNFMEHHKLILRNSIYEGIQEVE